MAKRKPKSEHKKTDTGTETLVRYVRDNTGGKAISMIQGANTYYFIYNGHGDVTALTDSAGTVVASYSYDEFGNLTSSTSTIYNPLRYSGANNAYYDSETSLYKMGTRYYQPEIGRWLTRDSIKGLQEQPQSQNRYVYVENNPLNMADPTGMWGDTVHYDMTYQIASLYMRDLYSRAIAQGSKDMDSPQNWAGSSRTNLEYHFSFYNSLNRRYKKCYKTAIYYLKKRNKTKAYWWLGMGLHSLQDAYPHPKGAMGVVMHGTESGIGMYGRWAGWWGGASYWYSELGSLFDDPVNNREQFRKALTRTDKEIRRFQTSGIKKNLL